MEDMSKPMKADERRMMTELIEWIATAPKDQITFMYGIFIGKMMKI